jgi:hypothetical protein
LIEKGVITMPSTTAAQCAANQRNSQQSTGPVTEAGKAKMRNNPLRHGLTSKHVVIEGEDPEEYEALRHDLTNDWKPADTQEGHLVTQLAEGIWRLMRARRVETRTYEAFIQSTNTSEDPDARVADCFHSNAKQFDNLRRYETTIERSYYRAMTELRKLQKERRKSELGSVSQNAKSQPKPVANLAPPAAMNPSHPPQSGFVSQNQPQSSASLVFSAPEIDGPAHQGQLG